MTEKWKDEEWAQDIWYRGKVTRRRIVGWGGGAIGAMMLVPAPWRAAFGAAKPYKIGSEQPLSGAGAAGGKTALVGLQMAVDRINHMGGIMGRPIELVIADDESKPDVARRKTQKMVEEDNIDVHVGGFLSNICLACMPVWEEAKIVNMISVCLDTTLTTTKCNRYSFRVHDYAPAQAVAFGPVLNKMGKKWHIAYADYSWGQSTRDAYADEIKKGGGEVVGTTGIPLGTADMTPFLSKIQGDFDGLFGIFFGKDGITIGNQAFDLGLTKKYKWAGDGAIAESVNLPALGSKIEGFVGINRYLPVLEGPLNTPAHKKFFDEAVARLKQIDPSGPLPDRYVQSNFEAMNFLKRHGEVRLPRPRGHGQTHRGPGGARDEGRGRLPPGRQDAPQGRPSGLPPRVHLRHQGRQAPDRRGSPEGEGNVRAGLQVRLHLSGRLTSSRSDCPGQCRPGRRLGPCPPYRRPNRPLRRPDRSQPRQLRPSAGRDPRDHRAKRGWQEHLLQLPDRRPAPLVGALPVQRRGHHWASSQLDLSEGHRPVVSDHQHLPERHRPRERPHCCAVTPARLEPADPPPRLPRHHREGRSSIGGGRPARQRGRNGRQPLPRRAAQS